MKKGFVKYIFIIIFIFFLFGFINAVLADEPTYADQPNYTLQVPLFGYKTASCINEYIKNLYQLALVFLIPIVIIVIIIAGVMWIFAGAAPGKIKTAQNMIFNAIAGLIIALLSFYILDLLNLTVLKCPEVEAVSIDAEGCNAPIPAPGTSRVPSGILPEINCEESLCNCQEVIDTFKDNNITVSTNRNCTSVNMLSEEIIQQVVLLQDITGCNLTVTSGNRPEQNRGVGACHGNSSSTCLDFRNNPSDHCLYDAIRNDPSIIDEVGIDQICTTAAYQDILVGCPLSAEAGNPDHIHIKF